MIAIIAAYAEDRVIGCNGKIPWNIENEKKRFKELTIGNVVIMGRRTYEEIGCPLSDRTNIVISNTCEYNGDNLMTAHSLKEAVEMAKDSEIYIAGGGGLYKESLPLADKLYITEVHGKYSGDTFFPEFDKTKYDLEESVFVDGKVPFTYLTYARNYDSTK